MCDVCARKCGCQRTTLGVKSWFSFCYVGFKLWLSGLWVKHLYMLSILPTLSKYNRWFWFIFLVVSHIEDIKFSKVQKWDKMQIRETSVPMNDQFPWLCKSTEFTDLFIESIVYSKSKYIYILISATQPLKQTEFFSHQLHIDLRDLSLKNRCYQKATKANLIESCLLAEPLFNTSTEIQCNSENTETCTWSVFTHWTQPYTNIWIKRHTSIPEKPPTYLLSKGGCYPIFKQWFAVLVPVPLVINAVLCSFHLIFYPYVVLSVITGHSCGYVLFLMCHRTDFSF